MVGKELPDRKSHAGEALAVAAISVGAAFLFGFFTHSPWGFAVVSPTYVVGLIAVILGIVALVKYPRESARRKSLAIAAILLGLLPFWAWIAGVVSAFAAIHALGLPLH